jgi:hypothetical protein
VWARVTVLRAARSLVAVLACELDLFDVDTSAVVFGRNQYCTMSCQYLTYLKFFIIK